MLWRKSLQENFRGEVAVELFLETHLPPPCTETSGLIAKIVKNCATQLSEAEKKVSEARVENHYAPSLIAYLEAVVSNFPQDTKPAFEDTHKTYFPPIDPEDYPTHPDITATRAGRVIPAKWGWSAAGTVLELKLTTDIFNKDGEIGDSDDSKNALVQIAKSARSLLASGLCFAFVVAVVGVGARILCFDRAGYRTSAAFDWTRKTHILPTFFWRLYNPGRNANQPARMYGEDDSISIPTPEEKKQMYERWQKTSSYNNVPSNKHMSFEEATTYSRWVNARKKNDSVLCFTIGPPLSQSDGLFSRATRVDRVVIKDDPNPSVYALKDAWREACRRPESDFYNVIRQHCEETGYPGSGMAQCLGSVELPGHRTILGNSDSHQHCHMRTLLTPVGIPLKRFESSQQLILALAAAVKHHRIAYEAGVIHRDISEGNVLFDEETMKGFLVDWDYAEFTTQGQANSTKWFPSHASVSEYTNIDENLKDLTGTLPFMAIQLLEQENVVHLPEHDLESFFWLITWMILLHTHHNHKDGGLACHQLFDAEGPADIKRGWIVKQLTPLDNKQSPLFLLTSILRELVLAQNPSIPAQPFKISFLGRPAQAAPQEAIPITYEDMERAFTWVQEHSSSNTFDHSPTLAFKPPRMIPTDGLPARSFRRSLLSNTEAGHATASNTPANEEGLNITAASTSTSQHPETLEQGSGPSTAKRKREDDRSAALTSTDAPALQRRVIDQMKPKTRK
ncbi:hypothetical protein B0H19DRAFT_396976 [Mycena capillaripes]|nr:hypothetical protein B0H19DRAFT_396976 [Mycena capillaripes]